MRDVYHYFGIKVQVNDDIGNLKALNDDIFEHLAEIESEMHEDVEAYITRRNWVPTEPLSELYADMVVLAAWAKFEVAINR
ncbi:MAG: hypothetical protein R6X35_15775, partial [Candidatus Krumholzibacteriia bacterium]